MIDLDGIQKRLARVWGKWPTAGVAAPNADEQGPKAWAAHGPPRFHATPQGRARQWVQAQADAEFLKHAPSDIAALVAEVERLRDEAELLRTGRDVTRDYADRVEAEVLALRGEVERERAAVATYLRGLADDYGVCIDLSLAEYDLLREVKRLRGEAERERAAVAESERNRSAIEEWAHRYGEALCPRSGDADSFGDGVRAAKQQVLTLLRGTP